MARSDRFTEKAQTALQRTVNFAEELGHTYIGTEHLLMALIVDKETISAKVLSAHKLSLSDIKKAAIDVSGSGTPCKVRASDMTPGLRRVIEISSNEAIKYSHRHIGTEHLLYAVISESECVGAKILESLNVSLSEIKSELIGLFEGISKRSEKSDANDKKSGKSESIAGCPAISEYGKDLTKLAARGKTDPIIGREKETERVVQILSRRSKNNPCLLGEPGVGKTAIVEGLAAKIASDNVPEMLRGKIIVTLDIPSMIAGAKYRGEFEERLKNVMKEAAQNPDIILFIDEIHTIIGAGAAEGAVDAANIIKPALARGEMQIIGATTLSEYRRFIEKDAAFERRFQAVMVEEPNPEDTITILKGLSSGYEKHHRLKISEKAIEASVKLSKRYITDRFLPDKAIDLIDEAASRLRIEAHTIPPKIKEMENEIKRLSKEKEEAIISQDFERAADLRDAEKRKKDEYERSKGDWDKHRQEKELVVTEEDIAFIVTQWTGIPVSRLMENESEKLICLAERLKERVIGQERAAEAVASSIRRSRTGISDPGRPIGSFIFLGPTGVGKTELTKALAEELFGSRDAIIRLDMSEYMERHSASKLVGSPPGYVGYDEGGLLTDKVRRKPYSVVLFDEIEKADPEIFNLLLQILDEGELTDAHGRKADFKNSVIVMTSNVGASYSEEGHKIGFSSIGRSDRERTESEEKMRNELKKTFRPEFLNRVDDIIMFERLGETEIKRIARKMLEEFVLRAGGCGIRLELDDSVTALVTEKGFDRQNGARPLRRAIASLCEDSFSRAVLSGELSYGDKVVMRAENDEIIFEKKKKPRRK